MHLAVLCQVTDLTKKHCSVLIANPDASLRNIVPLQALMPWRKTNPSADSLN